MHLGSRLCDSFSREQSNFAKTVSACAFVCVLMLVTTVVVLDSRDICIVLWTASKVQRKLVFGQHVVHSELLSQKIPLDTQLTKPFQKFQFVV